MYEQSKVQRLHYNLKLFGMQSRVIYLWNLEIYLQMKKVFMLDITSELQWLRCIRDNITILKCLCGTCAPSWILFKCSLIQCKTLYFFVVKSSSLSERKCDKLKFYWHILQRMLVVSDWFKKMILLPIWKILSLVLPSLNLFILLFAETKQTNYWFNVSQLRFVSNRMTFLLLLNR